MMFGGRGVTHTSAQQGLRSSLSLKSILYDCGACVWHGGTVTPTPVHIGETGGGYTNYELYPQILAHNSTRVFFCETHIV